MLVIKILGKFDCCGLLKFYSIFIKIRLQIRGSIVGKQDIKHFQHGKKLRKTNTVVVNINAYNAMRGIRHAVFRSYWKPINLILKIFFEGSWSYTLERKKKRNID